jgi:hypothetical protein
LIARSPAAAIAARLALCYDAEIVGGHGPFAAVTEERPGRLVLHRLEDPSDAVLFGEVRHVLALSGAGAERLAALEAARGPRAR